jgi:16S rRNA (guanine527-N7)-methyltransferase
VTAELVGLLTEARRLGYLGPGPVEAHLTHALAFAQAAPEPPARALDLGAGGGLPGLVLAARVWPSTAWTLLDAQRRRTEFLEEAVEDLGLTDRVSVLHGRAEDVGRAVEHRHGYALVVARSFASPAVTAECAAPLLVIGGRLVVSEPPDVALARRWPADGVATLGFGPAESVDGDDAAAPVHLACLPLLSLAPDRYPRRPGMPAKRPLF